MSPFEPQRVEFESETEQRGERGEVRKKKKRFSFDTEDIIALFAGIVALIFGIAMVLGKVPINKLTVGVVSFAGVGGVVAEIIKARSKRTAGRK